MNAIHDDYNKCLRVINSMTIRNINSSMRYINLFFKKWENDDKRLGYYYILKGCFTSRLDDLLKEISAKEVSNNKDPYGIPNVCFSHAKVGDEHWEEDKKQRIERGFDVTELWNLDTTILSFTLPRLKVFRDTCNNTPSDLDSKEQWIEIIDKMIFWMEDFIYGPNESKYSKKYVIERRKKAEDGKKLFFKYFNDLWW